MACSPRSILIGPGRHSLLLPLLLQLQTPRAACRSLPRFGTNHRASERRNKINQERNGDALLGQTLVELGYLNRWQVGQLLQGYTKFTLGSYQILMPSARAVWDMCSRVSMCLLGRTEAIKVLPKDQTNPASIAKFCHEIRTLARLDHPNLVRLTYADKDGETYFLVTEYVPGTNLRRLSAQSWPPLRTIGRHDDYPSRRRIAARTPTWPGTSGCQTG